MPGTPKQRQARAGTVGQTRSDCRLLPGGDRPADRPADDSPGATYPPTDPERKHEKGWGTADGEAERHRQQNGARRNTDRAGGCGRANTSGTADTHRTGDDDPGGPRGTAAVRISDRPRQKKPNDLFNIMPLW